MNTAPMVVQLTVDELRALIREEVAASRGAPPPNDILDPEEARALLKMKRLVFQRRVRAGNIPAIRIPGVRDPRFKRSELMKWLDGQREAKP